MLSLPRKITPSHINYLKAMKINSKVFHPSKLLNITVWESCLPLLDDPDNLRELQPLEHKKPQVCGEHKQGSAALMYMNSNRHFLHG